MMSKVQIPFVVNEGQYDKKVKYYANTFGGTVFVTANQDIVYTLSKHGSNEKLDWITIKENIVGGRMNIISGMDKALTKTNYFKGKDPQMWKNNVSTYNMINFNEVYDGIELKLKAYGNNVEKLFFVKPGAKPEIIRVKFGETSKLEINANDELEVKTEFGTVSFTKPIAYQVYEGERDYIDAKYTISGNEYGFIIGDYNAEETLVIDPLLASTFIGGSSTDDDYEPSIALDNEGNVFISGYTYSTNFPTTTGVFNEDYNGGNTDRFVSKFDNNFENLLASTFIGGTGNEHGMGLQITDNGFVCLAGYTDSPDFPTTSGVYEENHNGGRDAFVSILNNDLTTLQASTFLGGSGDEGFQWPRIDLVVDENNNVFVTGLTKSPNFPYTSGANDTTYSGNSDAFITKFNSNLTTLLGSTFLGGSMNEWRVSIILDDNENIYVCGETESSNFETTSGSYNTQFNGGSDIFLSKFSNDLTTLYASTFFGAGNYEEALAIKLDNDDNIFITGYTKSSDFPTSPNAFSLNYNGGVRDAYVAKFNNDLTMLIASTFVGGTGKDTGEDLSIDENGNIYIAGVTLSSNFPFTPGAFDESQNGGEDVFISKIDNNLSYLIASTFVGSSGNEKGQGIVIDDNANIYISGSTTSINFPITPEAYDTSYNGGINDCFILKIDSSLALLPTSIEESRKQPNNSNYFYIFPNPFKTTTSIEFSMLNNSKIELSIYNLNGQKIKTLINDYLTSGNKSVVWDGTDDKGKTVRPGIHLCKIQIDNKVYSNRIIFIK